jgi:predicted MFS family arabinose efflux permease
VELEGRPDREALPAATGNRRDESSHNLAMSAARESLVSGRLLLAFACALLVTGITNTFPVFFPPLLAEFGGSRAATASTITLIWLGGALLGPVAGWAVARWNPRAIVSLGLVAAALGFGLGSMAGSLTLFRLAVGVGAGIGVGLTGMVAQAALLADLYVRRRGAAMGIAFAGAMAGYGLAPPCQWMITRFGWRAALASYVVLVAALIPLAWTVLPPRLGTAGRQPAGHAARAGAGVRAIVGAAPFWLLFVVLTMPPIFGGLATTQHALYLTERGFSPGLASAMLGVGGVPAAAGRVLFGLMSDRIGARERASCRSASRSSGSGAFSAWKRRPRRSSRTATSCSSSFPWAPGPQSAPCSSDASRRPRNMGSSSGCSASATASGPPWGLSCRALRLDRLLPPDLRVGARPGRRRRRRPGGVLRDDAGVGRMTTPGSA